MEGPAKKEVAELKSLRVQLDVKPLQDPHRGGSKLHKSMTKHPSTETEKLVCKLRLETKPGLDDQPGIEPNKGPRYQKTSTPIRRTQAQIIAESVERIEIDKEASINLEEPSVCRTTPLQEKIVRLKVTGEEETIQEEKLRETWVTQPWAPKSSRGNGGGISEASVNLASIDFEDTVDNSKLLHRGVNKTTRVGASVKTAGEVVNTTMFDTLLMDVENVARMRQDV